MMDQAKAEAFAGRQQRLHTLQQTNNRNTGGTTMKNKAMKYARLAGWGAVALSLFLIASGSAFLVLFGLSVGVANAQEQAPVMPEILKAALRLEGKWEANASGQLGGKTHAFKYNMHFRKTASGSGLLMYETANIPDVGKLDGTNLIGYDPYDGKLHWFSVDNLGTTHDHTGELLSNDHIRLIHESSREGKPYREQIDIEWISADRVKIKLVGTLGGNVEEVLEGTFVRRSRH